jgi:hypothetical protein
MDEETRISFPYTEDFRRAKRNSLIWSGITVIAAFGSPPTIGGEATFGHLGLSLTYDKSVIVGISGTVAVFMALGFYQAYRRIRLHANQLFAGKTDVDIVFMRLRERAAAAIGSIDNINGSLAEIVDESMSGDFKLLSANLRKIDDAIQEPNATTEAEIQLKAMIGERGLNMSAERAQEVLAILRHLISQNITTGNLNNSLISSALNIMDKLREDMNSRIIQASQGLKTKVTKEESRIETEIAKLMKFHAGIYSSELKWFWGFDIAPVALLFAASLFPYFRLFFGS